MIKMKKLIPDNWLDFLADTIENPFFSELENFLEKEWKQHQVFPEKQNIFNALKLTPPEKVRVLILGQDPYHDDKQAHGLAFSVPDGIKLPPSLRNIYKELAADLDIPAPSSGNLESWAEQGVLLLNTVLTVRAHEANSHAGRGWEKFTDDILKKLNARNDFTVFLLWGGNAGKKLPLLDKEKHCVILSPHPSPLSAYRGFFGSKPFSRINAALQNHNLPPINWHLPNHHNSEMQQPQLF